MNRQGHENAVFFIGSEVEHTPANSKKTLFVVGRPALNEIESIASKNRVTHIFMGANHSFSILDNDPEWYYWNDTITRLLDLGYWVTLDYEAHLHVEVLKMFTPGVWQSRLFVPLLSVRIPKVQTSSPNLTIKIDDVDFRATNAGVWCLHHHEITDSNRFTDWQEYEADSLIEVSPVKESVSGSIPSYVLKVPVNVETNVTVTTETLNDADIGLDPTSPSQLKPDPVEEIVPEVVVNATTAADAANAYAEGAKEDPLGGKQKKGTKK